MLLVLYLLLLYTSLGSFLVVVVVYGAKAVLRPAEGVLEGSEANLG
jgi:hypothetical protein